GGDAACTRGTEHGPLLRRRGSRRVLAGQSRPRLPSVYNTVTSWRGTQVRLPGQRGRACAHPLLAHRRGRPQSRSSRVLGEWAGPARGRCVSTGRTADREPGRHDATTRGSSQVRVHDSLIDMVGNTPLVRLKKVTEALGPNAPTILAKVEYFNPGGSVTDRIALRMVEAAE